MNPFNLDTFWQSESGGHIETAQKTFETLKQPFAEILALSARAVRDGRKLLFFGNGGSAADAQHIAAELTVRYVKDRAPIPALALTLDPSAMTATGNDYGFEHLFSRQVEAHGRAGDVAVGISTSGNSPNVLNALRAARQKGLVTAGFSGRDGGKMPPLCDALLIVPSNTTARIQEMHITLGHMLCAALERELGLA